MRHRPYILLLAFLLLCAGECLMAREFYFRHYNNRHGLSHNTVYCVLQDRKGFMWFGTEDGLNRFDGHTFKVYRYNSYQPERSLSNDHILSLFEDSNGTLWVCTAYSICRYDEASDSFRPFTFPTGNSSGEYFSMLAEDKKQNLWMASPGRIIKYSLPDSSFVAWPPDQSFSPTAITITAAGEPLFADASSLYQYNPETGRFTSIPILTDREREERTTISAICDVPGEGTLIGTTKEGVKFRPSASRAVETIIPDIQVRAITPFSNSEYWIASESGLYIYNMVTRQTINLRKSPTNEYAISDNAIYSITRDREGGMWLGCFFGGISYLPSGYINFSHFIGGKTHLQMSGNAIREICADNYGNLWMGTEDNGINRFNLSSGEITNFTLNSPPHPLSATNIHGLLTDSNRLWVGTFNKGIELLSLPSGRHLKQYTLENTGGGLKSDFILCFHYLPDGQFLAGTATGTVVYDRKNDSFRPWKDINALVRQIYTDTEHNTWVATNNGLFRYDPRKDSLARYSYNPANSQTLPSNNTTSVFRDSEGRIWITTVNGLSMYNSQTDAFTRITVEDGLPSNITYRILEDDDHIFWISTANGLVRFNPDTHTMRTFTYTDGLHETQFNYSSSYRSPEGIMYMGTINGMIAFDPGQFREDTYTPPVYITQIHVPGHRYTHTGDAASGTEAITMPWNRSTFSLSYVALTFTSPDAISYAYKLEGADKDWNLMGRHKSVTFANLAPGRYTFRVKSTNSSGLWQENERQLGITIVPPFWMTRWAYAFYAIIALALAALFYQYKKSKLEEKHRTAEIQHLQQILELAVSPMDNQFLRDFEKYIESRLTDTSIPVEEIAAHLGMSASSLYRKVKALSGVSPNDLIRVVRLKQAVKRMKAGEKRIAEIAYQTGFSSPAYFSTCFQKQYSMTPTEYLKSMVD